MHQMCLTDWDQDKMADFAQTTLFNWAKGIKSLKPIGIFMCPWPLSKPMLTYCQLDPKEQVKVKF